MLCSGKLRFWSIVIQGTITRQKFVVPHIVQRNVTEGGQKKFKFA